MRTIPKSRVITRLLGAVIPLAVMVTGGGLAVPAGAVPPVAPTPGLSLSATPDLTPSFNGPVRALAYLGGTIYVGGEFAFAREGQRWVNRNGLAAINARTGELLPWRPSADDSVTALVTANGMIFAAGSFTRVNGEQRIHLAALDPTTGAVRPFMQHRIEGPVAAAAVGFGRLYLAGRILGVDGEQRYGAAAFSLATGALVNDWQPGADGRIESVTTGGGRVYLAGKFHAINGTRGTAFLGAVDPGNARLIQDFRPRARVVVHGVVVNGDRVYLAMGGNGGTGVATDATGSPLWSFTTDGDIEAISLLPGIVIFGGHFDNACRTNRSGLHGKCLDGAIPRGKLAAVNADDGRLLPWSANANGIEGVVAMTQDIGLGKIAAGGSFTSVAGTAAQRFVQFSLH